MSGSHWIAICRLEVAAAGHQSSSLTGRAGRTNGGSVRLEQEQEQERFDLLWEQGTPATQQLNVNVGLDW
ncbi:hypothetical protein CDL15_Pgr023736 [Punica granatum]|uniref:Uncharacterized protein n=1 Tax=Punica granatum TaxID=22663 RepID=A0A218WQY0_PUNGR|nr:hypothetical protein CDL15_Pgr023736 [Punica granatum]